MYSLAVALEQLSIVGKSWAARGKGLDYAARSVLGGGVTANAVGENGPLKFYRSFADQVNG